MQALVSPPDAKPPKWAVGQQNATHVLVLYMRAAGVTPKIIADRLGIGYHTVINLQQQPWFKSQLVELLASKGGMVVEELLRGASVEAFEVVLETLRDESAKRSDRMKASFFVLDKVVAD